VRIAVLAHRLRGYLSTLASSESLLRKLSLMARLSVILVINSRFRFYSNLDARQHRISIPVQLLSLGASKLSRSGPKPVKHYEAYFEKIRGFAMVAS